MCANWMWIAAEVVEGADPDEVAATLARREGADDLDYSVGLERDGVVTVEGIRGTPEDAETELERVVDRIERAVVVVRVDGGEGHTFGRYYETEVDELRQVEELEHPFGWRPTVHFDYFAAKYGIHGSV